MIQFNSNKMGHETHIKDSTMYLFSFYLVVDRPSFIFNPTSEQCYEKRMNSCIFGLFPISITCGKSTLKIRQKQIYQSRVQINFIRMQSQSPNRIQFKYSPNKGNIVSTPPVQRVVVVEQAHVSASPIKRVQASVDKQQIAETIYTKLQQINSKLYRMTQLELQNQVLKSQNERLAKNTPQNGTVQINEDQRQKEQAKQQININEMKKLQEQNAELKLKLEKYEKRLSQGRQIFSRILKDQSMKQKAQIDEMREIFDD